VFYGLISTRVALKGLMEKKTRDIAKFNIHCRKVYCVGGA